MSKPLQTKILRNVLLKNWNLEKLFCHQPKIAMSIEYLWDKYQTAYEAYEDSTEKLDALYAIVSNEDYGQYALENEDITSVKKRTFDFIKGNEHEIKKRSKEMDDTQELLMQKGISVNAFHALEIKRQADLHKDSEWKKNADHVIRSRNAGIGASGYVGICEEDDEDEEDVLYSDDDGEVSSENTSKVNFYRENDDIQECNIPYHSDMIAIKVGNCFLKPSFTMLLKLHQRQAIVSILKQLGSNKYGFLLAHAMGLGKTLTTIAFMEASCKCYKSFLVLSPKTLLHSWYEELQKWDSHLTLTYYPPVNNDDLSTIKHWNKRGGVLIVPQIRFRNYQLNGLFNFNPDVVIVDEAHVLKNKQTLFYKAVASLPSKKKLLLTGTPLQNNLEEYFQMLNLIAPDMLDQSLMAEYANIIDRGAMADADDNDITAMKTKIKVLSRLLEPVVDRRSSQYLKHCLPAMTDYKLSYPVHDYDESKHIGAFNKTFAIANHTIDIKYRITRKLVKSIRKLGERTLIFSKSIDVITTIAKKMNALSMTGQTTESGRQVIVEQFMSDESKYTELCMSTCVGGQGLNLQQANHIIILDPSWNPSLDTQACFRGYRFGQMKPVTIYRLIAENTIEERMYRLAVHKSLAFCRIIDVEDVERIYTKAELTLKQQEDKNNFVDITTLGEHSPLHKVKHIVDIYQHDILFAEAESEKLSEEEEAEAHNEFNKIMYKKDSRALTHPVSEVQTSVSIQDLFFPSTCSDESRYLVPPIVPVWRKKSNGKYSFLKFLPDSNLVESFVLELETPDGVKQHSLMNAMNYDKSYQVMQKGKCRMRVKMRVSDMESDWSGWSAYMYT